MVRLPHEFLEQHATWRPDEPAVYVTQTGETLTYTTLDERVNRVANALADRGLRPGDRVAMSLFNTVEFPLGLYGCFKIGAIPVALNYRLSARDYEHLFDAIRPSAVIYDSTGPDVVMAGITTGSPQRIAVGGFDEGGVEPFEALLDGSSDRPPRPSVGLDDTSYMITTSGTTGRPKVVAYSGRNGWARNEASIVGSETTPDSVWAALLPWFHGSGVDTAIKAPLTAGAATLTLQDYSDPAVALSAIEEYGVTHVMSVPTLSERFADYEDLDSYDLSSVEVWRHTGEVLTERQARKFTDRLTPNIYNSYGSSEAGLNTILRPSALPEHAGSVGRPSLRTEIRVVEFDSDRPVAPDEQVPLGTGGEVILRTDQLFRGNYPTDQTLVDRVRDGWYYTHDMGVVSEDGYLTITGRTDDMLLSGGELVSAVEVEDVLESHEAVEEAIVVGVPDDEWGERVTAYVQLREGSTVTADDLDAFCRDGDVLAGYKRPRAYEFVDELEHSEAGKKLRTAYRE